MSDSPNNLKEAMPVESPSTKTETPKLREAIPHPQVFSDADIVRDRIRRQRIVGGHTWSTINRDRKHKTPWYHRPIQVEHPEAVLAAVLATAVLAGAGLSHLVDRVLHKPEAPVTTGGRSLEEIDASIIKLSKDYEQGLKDNEKARQANLEKMRLEAAQNKAQTPSTKRE